MQSSKPTTLSLDDLSLWLCEKGPIRELVEIEFDIALDEAARDGAPVSDPALVREMHERVVPAVFLELLDGKRVVGKKGGTFFLSLEGQRELRRLMVEHMTTFLVSRRPINALPDRRGNELTAFHPCPMLVPAFRGFRTLLRRFLSP
ncbi:MAG: hypothetical protein PHW10_00070 [Candidatus Peribacteraceae bacterium]|nr:hypothetical protein [Candidatus Peribacteraceae bacterium]